MCDADEADAAVPDFWIGVAASALGSIILNLGLNLQRLAQMRLLERPPDERRPYVLDPLWLLGFLVFAVGNAGDAVGLAFTPQSVITPLGSFSVISNLFFARLLLGERIGLATLAAVALIVAGVVTIVGTADASCTHESVDTLLRRWQHRPFIAFGTLHVSLLLLTNGGVAWRERHIHRADGTVGSLTLPQRQQLRFAYALLGSMYATWTVLLTKSAGELVKASFRGDNQLERFETYLLLAGILVSAPMQIRYLNAGLRHFEALFIVPSFYSFWCFGSVLMGALFFGEFDEYRPWQVGVFAVGVVANVAGVALLARRSLEAGSSGPPKPQLELPPAAVPADEARRAAPASHSNRHPRVMQTALWRWTMGIRHQ